MTFEGLAQPAPTGRGFLDKYRSALPAEVKLYAGGDGSSATAISITTAPDLMLPFGRPEAESVYS